MPKRYIHNIFHDEEGMDIKALQDGGLDDRYVLVTGDSMTGTLRIDLASGNNALVIKAGQRLVLDG